MKQYNKKRVQFIQNKKQIIKKFKPLKSKFVQKLLRKANILFHFESVCQLI